MRASHRRVLGEMLGSAALAAIVVGSGIAAQQLSPTDTGLQLLENALVTAMGLTVLILVFAPISGAHFNPVVTLVDVAVGGRTWRDAAAYLSAQVLGCIGGTVLANAMFDGPLITWSETDRLTPAHFLAEVVATAGLIFVIFALARTGHSKIVAAGVGLYIGAAYFFTSSTSFANPAITIGRMFTDTFAGIAPSSAPGYVLAQLIGGALGLVAVLLLVPRVTTASQRASPPISTNIDSAVGSVHEHELAADRRED